MWNWFIPVLIHKNFVKYRNKSISQTFLPPICKYISQILTHTLFLMLMFRSTFEMLHFEKSSNMAKFWQKMKKNFEQLVRNLQSLVLFSNIRKIDAMTKVFFLNETLQLFIISHSIFKIFSCLCAVWYQTYKRDKRKIWSQVVKTEKADVIFSSASRLMTLAKRPWL